MTLPPLRERDGDVPLLVQFLVAKFGARVGRRIESIEQATMVRLIRYRWPGNIRELENVLERAIILANNPALSIDPEVFAGAARDSTDSHLPPAAADGKQAASLESLETLERNHIVAALKQTAGVIDGPKGAARILNLHPNTLRSRMKKLGIQKSGHEIS
jgi:formate hydrogenlyase transcriptional activator